MNQNWIGLLFGILFIHSTAVVWAQNSIQGTLRYDNVHQTPLAGIPYVY